MLDAAERVVGGVGEERLELGLGEVADLLAPLLARLVDRRYRVRGAPAAFDGVGEDRVQEPEVVEDALDGAAGLALGGDERLHVLGADLVEGLAAEVGEEVDAQERLVVGEGAGLEPDRLPVCEIAPSRFGQVEPVAEPAAGAARLDRLPQRGLGLGAGQALAGAGRPHRPEAAHHLAAVRPPLAVPALAAALVGVAEERAGAARARLDRVAVHGS